MGEVIKPIDPFYITQGFGVNPASYAQFGLKGHNGWDIRTKYSDTPEGRRYIKASFFSKFYKKGDEGNKGYGKYFDVVVQLKSIWKLTYAHCHSIIDFLTRDKNEEMAISNNTGNSTASHLHWTTKRIIINPNESHTVLNYDNGFFGAVNPQEFLDELKAQEENQNPTPPPSTGIEKLPKDSVIGDVYEFLTGKRPNQDTIDWRLSQGKNIVEIGKDICQGDGNFYDLWIKPHVDKVTNEGIKSVSDPLESVEIPQVIEEPVITPEVPVDVPQEPTIEDKNDLPIPRLVGWFKSSFEKLFQKFFNK